MARRHERRKCSARTTKGNPCKRWAIRGGTVCATHGGRSPQVKRKAKERLEEERVRRKIGQALAAENVPFEDPLEGLMTEVARSGMAVRAYEELVRDLEAQPVVRILDIDRDVSDELEDMTTVPTLVPGGIIGPNHLGDLGAHPFVVLWSREREWHAKVCKMALEAGVAERQVRLAERQGELLAQTIEALLADPALELTHAQRSIGRQVAARHLRSLPTGEAV